MDGQSLMNELNKNRKVRSKAIGLLHDRGYQKAKAEHDYRVALQEEMVRLKIVNKTVTGIADLARGDKKVAELKMKRDIAETLYETAKQKIYQAKSEIGIIENLMSAERQGS